MNESKKVRAVGVLAAVVAAGLFSVGCSSAAPTQEDTRAPAVDVDHAVATQTIEPNTGCVNPPSCLITSSAPISSDCPMAGGVRLPARHVVALRKYLDYPFFQDGYKVRFPTPWVTFDKDPEPYDYERKLIDVAPSAGAPTGRVRHEYLVHELSAYKPPYTWMEGGRDWFFVGMTNGQDYTAALNLAKTEPFNLPAPEHEVEAQIGHCVRVLKIVANNHLYDSGEWYPAYDVHDPISHPY